MASWQAEDTSQGIIQHESAQTLLVHGSAQATQQHNADPGSEFGFISELNSRICDMQGKLETQEAQLRRKAQVPASNQVGCCEHGGTYASAAAKPHFQPDSGMCMISYHS